MSVRVPALDGLRGIAILLVLFGHSRLLPMDAAGPVGVTVFFVLSGYLISGLLLDDVERRGGIRWGRFYRRRLVRLAPALIFMLSASWIMFFAFEEFEGRAADTAMVLGYSFNWWKISTGVDGPLGHMWSLAVEEQFYLLWPIILAFVAGRWGRAGLVRACVALVAVSALWRVVLALTDHGAWAMYGTDANAASLVLGAWVAAAAPQNRRLAVGVAGAALLVVLPLAGGWQVLAQLVAAAATAVLIVARPRWLTAQPLVGLGRISYGVYLWHYPLLFLTWPLIWPGYLLTLLVASVSWILLERPLIRWASRREPSNVSEQRHETAVPAPRSPADGASPRVTSA